MFFQHSLCFNKFLLEGNPFCTEIIQHLFNVFRYRHFILFKDGELVMQGRELCFCFWQTTVEGIPKLKAGSKLIKGLWRLADTEIIKEKIQLNIKVLAEKLNPE